MAQLHLQKELVSELDLNILTIIHAFASSMHWGNENTQGTQSWDQLLSNLGESVTIIISHTYCKMHCIYRLNRHFHLYFCNLIIIHSHHTKMQLKVHKFANSTLYNRYLHHRQGSLSSVWLPPGAVHLEHKGNHSYHPHMTYLHPHMTYLQKNNMYN